MRDITDKLSTKISKEKYGIDMSCPTAIADYGNIIA